MTKKLTVNSCLGFVLCGALLVSLQGCFFVYLPGSVTGAISDAVTGDEGENCVADAAKVGDVVKAPDGRPMTIKSLSGKSSRCQQPGMPIRAMLVSPTFSSSLRMVLPSDWGQQPLTDVQKTNGVTFFAVNKSMNAGVMLNPRPNSQSTALALFSDQAVQNHMKKMANPSHTLLHEVTCSGHAALEIDITGVVEGGKTITYADTFVQGDTEIAMVISWTNAENFPGMADKLRGLCNFVAGL